ncbi:MAG TPA: RNA polymerase subunit sigma-70 [Actinomycetota bacterium]|nr:RNA polymerase subunit sigma-70 [Actinomycetota bacterium]
MIDGNTRTAAEPLELQLERWRGDLTAYCYRMLGSTFEAEDAVQESFMRAWRSFDSFEGRAELRTWLYRIATNVCLSALRSMGRRARPMDLGSAGTAASPPDQRLQEAMWIEPIPDSHLVPLGANPAEIAEIRESVRLAFVAALQHLAPKQRAVLILREVLKWKASEVADLLSTTVAAVNGALQRARATLANAEVEVRGPREPLDVRTEFLLALYIDAFERYDMEALTCLLHQDATWTMPHSSCGSTRTRTSGDGVLAVGSDIGLPGACRWAPTPRGPSPRAKPPPMSASTLGLCRCSRCLAARSPADPQPGFATSRKGLRI